MKRLSVYFLAILLGLSGCASYAPTSATAPASSSLPFMVTDGNVTVGADPYTQAERLKACFGGDLNDVGVLPIQVIVRNDGDRKILVRPSDVILVIPNCGQFCPAGASAAASKMESIGGVVASGVAFGIIGVLVASNAEDKARAARLEDYKRKELQESRLGPGESASGFLYFVPPPGTKAFNEADVVFRPVCIDDATSSVVKLPVSRLNFNGVKQAGQ